MHRAYKPLIRVTREILEWASSGRSGWVPQDALQALDVVLKQVLNCYMAQMSVWHRALGHTCGSRTYLSRWIGVGFKAALRIMFQIGIEREYSLREHRAELLPNQGRDLGCWLWQGGEGCGSTVHNWAASVCCWQFKAGLNCCVIVHWIRYSMT